MMRRRVDYQGTLSDEEDDGGHDERPQETFEDEETGCDGSPNKTSLEIDGASSNEEEDEEGEELAQPKGMKSKGTRQPIPVGRYTSQLNWHLISSYLFVSIASHKTIGKLGSYAIAVNALAGPGILQLPFTYQQAGVIPTTVGLLVVGLISALCCMHTANVVSKVPGNSNFDKVIEFSDPYRIFWGRRAYYGTQIVFYLCTLCVNIAAIVDTSQIVDSFFGHSPMGTWGFSFDNGGWNQWIHQKPCSRNEVKLGECLPFDGEQYGQIILTMGYMITTAVFLPICLMDLKVTNSFERDILKSNDPVFLTYAIDTVHRKTPHGKFSDSLFC